MNLDDMMRAMSAAYEQEFANLLNAPRPLTPIRDAIMASRPWYVRLFYWLPRVRRAWIWHVDRLPEVKEERQAVYGVSRVLYSVEHPTQKEAPR